MLHDMEMIDLFDSDIRVPPLDDLSSIMKVIESVDLYQPSDEGYQKIMRTLSQAGYDKEGSVLIGIKRLLSLIEMARQDEDDPGESGRFVQGELSLWRPH